MREHWVIPDIHGCSKTLRSLIEDMIKPSKHDWLYFLGDYIDRGPDSKGVIDYLQYLQKEDYNLRLLMGNHEDYLVKSFEEELQLKSVLGFKQTNKKKKEWLFFGGKQTMESFKINDLKQFPQEYIEWMRNLEYYVELEQFILVHAGFNFKNGSPFTDTDSMLWIRDYDIDSAKISNKRIIHGHVPVSLEFIDLSINNKSYKFIDLDNGCYMTKREGFGNLVALELNTLEYKVQYNLDL
ncbi:MAG: metallophosphoesterase [Bacteroidales bacterium]|nr:metallophosphoesterase [Bacteroidales bacterium]MCF8403721.1 metallophosphoesterase [Bacteroidales bacterium]